MISKRGINGMEVPKKRTGLVFRETATATANTRDDKNRARAGCSNAPNPPVQKRSSEKAKVLRPSIQSSAKVLRPSIQSSAKVFRPSIQSSAKVLRPSIQSSAKVLRPSIQSSSNGKEVVGSSRSRRTSANAVKPLNEPRRILSSSGLPAEKEGSVIRAEVGKSGTVSNLRSQRNFNQRPGLRQRETESIGPARQAASSKYGLRNLRCNTVTDVIPSSCSSSDSSSTLNRSKTIVTKMRSSEGESSSTLKGKKVTGSSLESSSTLKGKKVTGSSLESSSALKGKKVTGSSLERLNSGTRNGRPSSDTRGSRNIPPLRDNSRASVRTERTVSGYARGRFSNQGNENSKENNGGNSRVSVKTERTVSGYGRGRFSKQGNEKSKEKNESRDVLPNSPHSIDINSPVTEEFRGVMPMSHEEHGTRHSLIIQDGFRRHHNMDGISEVLLALERMEQNEELTQEQIDLLETNSLLDGLSFYDTHRDMRLDIDDMSYEELLALEERMGTVSTALSEETLSNSLKKSVYESTPSDDAADCVDEDNNEIKCCICQEEYVVGDEIGRLQCTHKYHVDCIQEWLRLKNWCPMCKESAALSKSSSSSSSH